MKSRAFLALAAGVSASLIPGCRRTRSAKTIARQPAARHAGAAAARGRADRGGDAAAGAARHRAGAQRAAAAAAGAAARAAAPQAEPPKPVEPPKTEPPVEPPKPAEEAAEPPSTLQTTPATAEGEVERGDSRVARRARPAISTASTTAVLNADARTQYDTAKRFIRQAEDALRAKNLVFAKSLADKAAALAAQLGGR